MSSQTSLFSSLPANCDPDLLPRSLTNTHILGTSVTAMTLDDMHDVIAAVIAGNRSCKIAHHNLHSFYLLQREIRSRTNGGICHFAEFYRRAEFTTIDGMSMVLLAKLLGCPISRNHRFSYSYTLSSTLRHAELSGWRVFYLGSSPQTVATANEIIRNRFPKLSFLAHHGFFAKGRDRSENREVLKEIASFRPQVLFVGMGMPIQEGWLMENYASLNANVIITSGASLDYIAGTLKAPPKWVGEVGLQWLYRLLTEPKRLGRRYLVEPFLTLWYLAGNALRGDLSTNDAKDSAVSI